MKRIKKKYNNWRKIIKRFYNKSKTKKNYCVKKIKRYKYNNKIINLFLIKFKTLEWKDNLKNNRKNNYKIKEKMKSNNYNKLFNKLKKG